MIELWIDGSCFLVNHLRIASVGFIIKKGEMTIAKSSKIVGKGKKMTNNIAEYNAFIYALREIKRRQLNTEEILVRSNSRLLVNQIRGSWKAKTAAIFPLYREARQIAINLKLKIKWISKEMNIEANEIAYIAVKNWTENNCDLKDSYKDEKTTFSCISTDEKNKQQNNLLKENRNGFKKYKEIERIGETENFLIDYDVTFSCFFYMGKRFLVIVHSNLVLKKTKWIVYLKYFQILRKPSGKLVIFSSYVLYNVVSKKKYSKK